MNPGDVHAIVVGVEKYDTGGRWNLNGPALDAIRFAKWLRDRDIPPENILLFASPLQENQNYFDQEVAACGVECKRPESEAIRLAITADIAQRRGGLLFVFWGGHGVMNEGRRYLFPANVRETDLLTFDFEQLRGFCQSTKMQGFARQIFVVDACANYFDLQRSPERLGQVPIMPGFTKGGVSQFVLFAVRDGQLSKNLDALRSGLFSSIFLEELAKEPEGIWPPDLQAIQGRILGRFEELRLAGKSSQMPSFLLHRDWDGNTSSRYVSMQPELDPSDSELVDVLGSCPPMQTQTARDEFIGGLKLLRIPSADEIPSVADMRLHVEIMVWGLKRARCEQELIQGLLQRGDPGPHNLQLERVIFEREQTLFDRETIVRLRALLFGRQMDVKQLQKILIRSAPDRESDTAHDAYLSLMMLAGLRRDRRKIDKIVHFFYPALVFAEKLAEVLEPADAVQLREIVRAIAQRRNVLTELENLKSSAHWNVSDDDITLVFTMRPKAGGISLGACLLTGDGVWTPLETEDRPASEDEAKQKFRELVKLAESRPGELMIEVVLPRENFGWPVDQWKIALGKINVPVGAYYPVVLRWDERLRDERLKHLWAQKWSVADKAPPLWILEKGKPSPSQLAAKLCSRPDAGAFIAFGFPPHDASSEEDALLLALNCGTPVAIWWRECDPDPATAQIHLNKFLADKSPNELPKLFREIRNDAEQQENPEHPGYRLALMYDNPKHIPPLFGK